VTVPVLTTIVVLLSQVRVVGSEMLWLGSATATVVRIVVAAATANTTSKAVSTRFALICILPLPPALSARHPTPRIAALRRNRERDGGVRATAEGSGLGSDGGGGRGGVKGLSRRSRLSINSSIDMNRTK
jgi:hypothetical protein